MEPNLRARWLVSKAKTQFEPIEASVDVDESPEPGRRPDEFAPPVTDSKHRQPVLLGLLIIIIPCNVEEPEDIVVKRDEDEVQKQFIREYMHRLCGELQSEHDSGSYAIGKKHQEQDFTSCNDIRATVNENDYKKTCGYVLGRYHVVRWTMRPGVHHGMTLVDV